MKINLLILLPLIFSSIFTPIKADSPAVIPQPSGISADAIIAEVNSIRTGYGLPALIVDPILMSTAQSTSDYMAAYDIHSHIGGVSERVKAAGFGGGATVFATENFAVGIMTLNELIYTYWADELHMYPMTNGNYTHIGVGVSEVDGYYYYVLHAAYVSGGSYVSGTTYPTTEANATESAALILSEIIYAVNTVTPSADGLRWHTVQQGQSYWSIGTAYGITGNQIREWNNLATSYVLYPGDEIIVSGTMTPGPSPTSDVVEETPTPTVTSTPIPSRTTEPVMGLTRTAVYVAVLTESAQTAEAKLLEEDEPDNGVDSSMTLLIGGVFVVGIGMLVLGFVLGKRAKS